MNEKSEARCDVPITTPVVGYENARIINWLTWGLRDGATRKIPLQAGAVVEVTLSGANCLVQVVGEFRYGRKRAELVRGEDGWWSVTAMAPDGARGRWESTADNLNAFALATYDFFDALAATIGLAEGWDK